MNVEFSPSAVVLLQHSPTSRATLGTPGERRTLPHPVTRRRGNFHKYTTRVTGTRTLPDPKGRSRGAGPRRALGLNEAKGLRPFLKKTNLSRYGVGDGVSGRRGRDESKRHRAESQWIVAARPLCHLQYPVAYLSRLQRILPVVR